ncbi:MAG: Aminodeoxyfutalosine deaminase [Chloroflexi bacterium]|nr:Aminodeoxyfutalosine deaminase [Chloroflexota bacterium]
MIDKTFPLIDLHRHLDGSVRLETILDLGRKHDLPLPAWTVEALRPHVQITQPRPGVMAFIDKFKWVVGGLADYDACRRIAYENVEDAFREGIDYIELRFSPWFMSEPHQLDPEGVVEAVVEGIGQARGNFDVLVNLIGIISRTYGTETAWKELAALLTKRDDLVGLDLAGDEANFSGELFVDHIRKGREAGWAITIHAGEERGPASIWQALNDLEADRIGHGISASQDPDLMDHLAEQRVGLEINLTSNLQTTVVPDLISHPLRQFLSRGILATINTDDPGISGIDLPHEYNVAAPAAGLTQKEISQAQRNALEVAFLSPQEKQALLKKPRKKE